MRAVLLLALVALPSLGAELWFEPGLHLGGTVRVRVTGIGDAKGQAALLVLRTGELMTVSLEPDGDGLASAPIHLRRPCDPADGPSLGVQVGDTVAAATELGGGLAAAGRVEPPLRKPGEPTLALERWDNEALKWVQARDIVPALYRMTLSDRSLDTTCERERADLPLALAEKEFSLPLVEEEATGGRFEGTFVVGLEPRACSLWLSVSTVEGKLLAEVEVPAGACLVCRRAGDEIRFPVPEFPVNLAPTSPAVPVGCVGEVRLVQPERPDEVRWCVDGTERPGGTALPLFADAPRTVSVVALVRMGLLWERGQITAAFVPQVRLSLVGAETGLPAAEPWPCPQALRVRAEHVPGPGFTVLVGKLGPDPKVVELALIAGPDGGWVTPAFRPTEIGACAGDVLWAQFRDPRGCYAAYVTLPLR